MSAQSDAGLITDAPIVRQNHTIWNGLHDSVAILVSYSLWLRSVRAEQLLIPDTLGDSDNALAPATLLD